MSKLAQGRQRCGYRYLNLLSPEGEFSDTEEGKKQITLPKPGSVLCEESFLVDFIKQKTQKI